jgi:hypothetical protein
MAFEGQAGGGVVGWRVVDEAMDKHTDKQDKTDRRVNIHV